MVTSKAFSSLFGVTLITLEGLWMDFPAAKVMDKQIVRNRYLFIVQTFARLIPRVNTNQD